MALLLQRIFDGLFNGAIYASLALALVTIYRSTGLVNFAQGELATFCGYIALVLATPVGPGLAGGDLASWLPGHPWPTPLAVLGAIAVGMCLGALIERFVFRDVGARSSELAAVNLTIGLLILLSGITTQVWGTNGRRFPELFPAGPDDFVGVGGARLRFTTLGVWATLLVVLALLNLIMRKTKIGLAFRAVTSDRQSAALAGVPVGPTLMTGWAVAAGLGALAASLVATVVILEPFTMLKLLIYALAAATLGGLDSPKGAIVGGLVVAQAQTLVPGYLGLPSELAVVAAVVVLIVVLFVRPAGLYGTKRVERV